MNFTLNGRVLKYVNEDCILIYRNSGVWKNKPNWYELVIRNDTDGYKIIAISLKHYKLHRIIAYLFIGLDIEDKKKIIDHIDGNKLNNNLENLRIVTNQQNNFNRPTAKGIWYDKTRNKFKPHLELNGKSIYLGRFDTEEEARQAYLDAKKIYHVIP